MFRMKVGGKVAVGLSQDDQICFISPVMFIEDPYCLDSNLFLQDALE